MNLPENMRIFVRVAELASFTQAAEHLGLPKASVSTAIQQLEAHLGTRLLQRTTRRVHMTQDGEVFYQRSKDMLADIDELEGLFQQAPAALTGKLRVDMPQGLAKNIILPNLPAFLEQHPRLEIELSSTDRRVDLVREGFDCVIRAGVLGDSNLIAKPLGAFRQINCASPAYLARHGTPTNLADLAHHKMVHYTPVLGAKPLGWEYQQDGQIHTLPITGAISVNSTESYLAGCLAGLGIIQLPEVGIRGYLAQGELVEVLADFSPPPIPISVLYVNRRHLSHRTRTFITWIEQTMAPFLIDIPR